MSSAISCFTRLIWAPESSRQLAVEFVWAGPRTFTVTTGSMADIPATLATISLLVSASLCSRGWWIDEHCSLSNCLEPLFLLLQVLMLWSLPAFSMQLKLLWVSIISWNISCWLWERTFLQWSAQWSDDSQIQHLGGGGVSSVSCRQHLLWTVVFCLLIVLA